MSNIFPIKDEVRTLFAAVNDEFEIGDRVVPGLAASTWEQSGYDYDKIPAGTVTDKQDRGDFDKPGYKFQYLVKWDESWMNDSNQWEVGFTLAPMIGEQMSLLGSNGWRLSDA